MKPFRERNPVPIGAIGVVAILAALLLAFNANKLPFIGGGRTIHADFANAGGLLTGDDVRIAGVKIGQVSSLHLISDPRRCGSLVACVRVGLRLDSGLHIGPQTTADIKIKTLLGQKYVALTPMGSGNISGDIPPSRTTTPLDVTAAFNGFGQRLGEIDVKQLATAFDTLAAAFKDTPPYVRSSLVGLERLSTTIASRDAALQRLLADANTVTNTLAARDAEVAKLINDSNLILTTVFEQRVVVHKLLVDTAAVANQLAGLVNDNRALLKPALDNLNGTLSLLQRNQDNLDATIHLAAPFIRDFTDVLGNGRWFETVLWNLPGGVAANGCLKVITSGPQVCPPPLGTGP